MEDQKNLEAIMGLIMFGGNAKSDAMEAIAAAKKGDFTLADEKIQRCRGIFSPSTSLSNRDADARSTRKPR